MQRFFGFGFGSNSNTPNNQSTQKASGKHKKKPARPALVQYLNEHGEPVGAPVRKFVPSSSRSSSISSSSRNSIATSAASRKTSMSSLSSTETEHKSVSKQDTKASLTTTPAAAQHPQPGEKPPVAVQEVKPAKFNSDQSVRKRKGKCESSKVPSKQSSSTKAAKQPSKIANRPSVEALIAEQQKRIRPPECIHDELELEEHLGMGYMNYDTYYPEKTSKGQLVWVFKPNSGRRWRD